MPFNRPVAKTMAASFDLFVLRGNGYQKCCFLLMLVLPLTQVNVYGGGVVLQGGGKSCRSRGGGVMESNG